MPRMTLPLPASLAGLLALRAFVHRPVVPKLLRHGLRAGTT
jgi:hypothetical protein